MDGGNLMNFVNQELMLEYLFDQRVDAKQLRKDLDRSRQHSYDLLGGRSKFTLEYLITLSDIYGFTVKDFIVEDYQYLFA